MVIGAASSTVPSTLLGLARFITDTQSNVASFSDADILAIINNKYRDVQSSILTNIMNEWRENTEDGTGSGAINLVAGTQSYSFATDIMTLDRVEVNYTGDSNDYTKVDIVKLNSITDKGVLNTDDNTAVKGSKSAPIAWIRDGAIYLDPMPDLSVTNGLMLWTTTLVTDLVLGTGATSTPVFNAAFHEILAYLAAAEWLNSRDQAQKAGITMQQSQMILQKMLNFYATRTADEMAKIKPRRRDMN